MITAILNNKGGVGKTTTAVNLAAALAGKRCRVLLVDIDSQGSASLSLGVPRAELQPSSAEVLFDGLHPEQAIRPTPTEGLFVLPGSMRLANADLVLGSREGREFLLRDVLHPLRHRYEHILVDCPPSLSLLPLNALLGSDQFLVPVTPSYLALEGLVNLFNAVDKIYENFGCGSLMSGILLTMVDYRNRATGEIVEMIRNQYKDAVYKAEIRINVRLAEAPSFGCPIFSYAQASSGALAYRKLSREFLHRIKKGMAA